MAYSEHLAEANRLVVGRRTGDPAFLDDEFHKRLQGFYDTARLFFVPSAVLLRGHANIVAAEIRALKSELQKETGVEPRLIGVDELNRLARGEAATLQMCLRFDASMALLEQRGSDELKRRLMLLRDDPMKEISHDLAQQSQSEVGITPAPAGQALYFYRVPTLGIVPSIHKADGERFSYLQDRARKSTLELSAILSPHNPGVWKEIVQRRRRVTKSFVLAAVPRIQSALGAQQGFLPEDFEENALFRAEQFRVGDKALSHDDGNHVPGLWQYR